MNKFAKALKKRGLKFMTFEIFAYYAETEKQYTAPKLFSLVSKTGMKVVIFGDEIGHPDPRSLHIVTNVTVKGREATSHMREATDEEMIAFNTEAASVRASVEARRGI